MANSQQRRERERVAAEVVATAAVGMMVSSESQYPQTRSTCRSTSLWSDGSLYERRLKY